MPIDTIGEARDEILKHFTTQWNAQTPPVPALFYEDKTQDLPDDDDPYARITVRHNDMAQKTVGGNTGSRIFERDGVVVVQIFAPNNDGLQEADRLANIAHSAFEGQKTAEDRVDFRNVRIREVGQEGPWFQVNVIADFDWYTVK